jgi:hypothetical protein
MFQLQTPVIFILRIHVFSKKAETNALIISVFIEEA